MSIGIFTAAIEGPEVQACIRQTAKTLSSKLAGGRASLLICFHRATADNTAVFSALKQQMAHWKELTAPLVGCSSFQGTMTEDGCFGRNDFGIGILALADPEGAYGVGFDSLSQAESAGQAALNALDRALIAADRAGEQPELIWLHTCPGNEEEIIEALDSELGGHVPIIGGSCADQEIAGNWHCFNDVNSADDGITLAVFFPSDDLEITYAFQGGYEPTEQKGIVTKSNGRILKEIDGKPAGVQYSAWCDGLLDQGLHIPDTTNILNATTLTPLGRKIGTIQTGGHEIPYYTLIHPDTLTPDKSLTLFSKVSEGQELLQMKGSIESLINRPRRVIADALSNSDEGGFNVLGGIMIYCAGCRLAVESNTNDIVGAVNDSLHHKPFITAFTFGEQGCLAGGENVHGNLMISTVIFYASKPRQDIVATTEDS
jgi:hypothetical protein